jgi:putative ABC transport system permease protein
MLKAGWTSLMARKLRLVMSAFAIILGVAFVAGSFIFTDTLGRAFDGIVAGSVGDVIVQPVGSSTIDGPQTSRTVPAGLVDELAGVAGAARVDGNVTYSGAFVIDSDGKLIGGQGAPALGVNYTGGPAADGREFGTIDTGRWPERSGEVVLDAVTAARSGYAVGDAVPVLTPGEPPRVDATLVGTVSFGGGIVGASVAVFETEQAQALFLGGADSFNDVWVSREPGVSQDELKAAVDEVLPAGYESVTGAVAADQAANSIGQALSFINTFLLVFAAVALVVGAFLIVNTFSILVAQRSRELALFRAIGATRTQVTRSVVLEAVAIGLVGSTAGLALGAALAKLIQVLFGQFGLDLSGTPLAFGWKPVVAAYATGMLFTVLAAYFPARRAGKVPPVAAMRDDAVVAESSMHRRAVLGSVLIGLGIAGLGVGLFLPDAPRPLIFLGLGILGVLLGVALTSPILGRPLLAVFGAAYRRLFGAVGAMAHENSLRNPRRTAATASALMIGLTLVAMMSVFGASAKASIDRIVEQNAAADFVVSNPVGQPFAPSVSDRLASVEGVEDVVRVRGASIEVDGSSEFAFGVEPGRFDSVIPLAMVEGSLADVGPGSLAVSGNVEDIAIGDTVTVTHAGESVELTVASVFERTPVLGNVDYVLDLGTMATLGVPELDALTYVTADGTVPLDEVQASLDASVADVPVVTVNDQAGYAEQLRGPVDQLLFIIYALLGLAVVIAVLGIVNTLALSVIERTREIGLLRAVGLSRRQLRRMIRLESVVIAVLGAALGVGLGIAFGVAVQRSLVDEGFEVLRIPVTQLGAFVLLAAVVGVLAAWWPGRRAANLDVLEAIATE